MKQAATNLLALASTAYAAASSPAGTKSGCYWNTDAGQFNTRFGHDFSVDLYGTVENLIPSTYTVNQGVNPLARRFDIANIGFDGVEKALTLTVPGGQSNGMSTSPDSQRPSNNPSKAPSLSPNLQLATAISSTALSAP